MLVPAQYVLISIHSLHLVARIQYKHDQYEKLTQDHENGDVIGGAFCTTGTTGTTGSRTPLPYTTHFYSGIYQATFNSESVLLMFSLFH